MKKISALNSNDLEIHTNTNDLRRDLYAYMEYILHNDVKRHYKSNLITKTDSRKIARQMTDPSGIEDYLDEDGIWPWLNYIDRIALAMDFVSYKTKGEYIGYYSSGPTFVDNYIGPVGESYSTFLGLSVQAQEEKLLACQVESYSDSENEFFTTFPLGLLQSFDTRGCATGVVPYIKFDEARMFLFETLKEYPPGEWTQVSSLVAGVKEKDCYFIIPRKPSMKYTSRNEGRYCNFSEGEKRWDEGKTVAASDPDAFERVEGRYIERFLEHIPLAMGYVELAYAPGYKQKIYPSIGHLVNFRTTPAFYRFMHEGLSEPKVTVLSNFEVQVQADVYPASVVRKLSPIAVLQKTDRACVFILNRVKAIAACADDNRLDIIALLRSISSKDIPANIEHELRGWIRKSESFVLYTGFGLLECDGDLPEAEPFTVEKLSTRMRIVRSPDKLLNKLDAAGRVPLLISHASESFCIPPSEVRTQFPKAKKRTSDASKETITLTVSEVVSYKLAGCGDSVWKEFIKEFKYAGCKVKADKIRRELTFDIRQRAPAERAIKSLKGQFEIDVGKATGNV